MASSKPRMIRACGWIGTAAAALCALAVSWIAPARPPVSEVVVLILSAALAGVLWAMWSFGSLYLAVARRKTAAMAKMAAGIGADPGGGPFASLFPFGSEGKFPERPAVSARCFVCGLPVRLFLCQVHRITACADCCPRHHTPACAWLPLNVQGAPAADADGSRAPAGAVSGGG